MRIDLGVMIVDHGLVARQTADSEDAEADPVLFFEHCMSFLILLAVIGSISSHFSLTWARNYTDERVVIDNIH